MSDMTQYSAAIYGCLGESLNAFEKSFFAEQQPFGFILFQRNCTSPDQLKRLVESLYESVGRDTVPVLIDQEGGRVARLKAPLWRTYPPAEFFAEHYPHNPASAVRGVYLNARLMAAQLRSYGITVNCAPLADIPVVGSHNIIGDRAFGDSPEPVIALSRAQSDGLLDGGVLPILKHIPGHGRATVDSHKELPRIKTSRKTLENTDFIPFRALADAPMAMTAHAVYECNSRSAVTVSKKSLTELVRAAIGFNGLVMTDDLDMKALKGSLTRKTERSLAAGCDIALQCSGKLPAMVEVAKGAKILEGRSKRRAIVAEYCAEHITPFDRKAAEHEFDTLLSQVPYLKPTAARLGG